MRSSARALLLAALLLAGCGGGGGGDRDKVALAKEAYAAAKARGVVMRRGPCLGVIAPGWVADVSHEPRLPVDDLPQNQCAAFRSGEAKHFVELDPSGRLIRTG